MIVLEAAEDQLLKFIGRTESPSSGSILITDQHTNDEHTFIVMSFGTSTYYNTATIDLSSLTNERMYTISITAGGSNVYKGTMFLTSQDVSDYEFNNGVYLEHDNPVTYLENNG